MAGIAGAAGLSVRVGAAVLVVAAYAAFCAAVYIRHRRRTALLVPSGSGASAGTLVAFASQTGFAEELAMQTAALIEAGGHAVQLASFEALDMPALQRASRALFVVATTGEGDAPDSAARFCRHVMPSVARLDGLEFGVLALGDRDYAQYCSFGYAVEAWLRSQGARPLFDLVDVDDGDPAAISLWRTQVSTLHGSSGGTWAGPTYDLWRLAERRLLNPGSPGGPAFHVALEARGPVQTEWQAGDIAEIVPAAADSVPPAPGAPTREYSIASLPADNRIELLVRQVQHADGTLGLGSGWLTAHVPLDGRVWLRVRRNSAFHPPDPERPLVLIGNGTGLAGLRAHIKARALAGPQRTWLLFGERTRRHDAFYDDELDDWLARGVLERCDRAYSRDVPRQYVQDVLRHAGAAVRCWVEDGAAIYVCGSRDGMSTAVHDVLVDLLGSDRLERLRDEGRYRRDVY